MLSMITAYVMYGWILIVPIDTIYHTRTIYVHCGFDGVKKGFLQTGIIWRHFKIIASAGPWPTPACCLLGAV